MVLTKSERIEVGKKVHEGEMSGVTAALKALDAAYKVYRGFDKMSLENKGHIIHRNGG